MEKGQPAQMINVRKVFHDKNPKVARVIPGVVYRYLERVVHQEDINDILRKHGEKYGIDFVRAIIEDFNISLTLQGEENLPRDRQCIFASNHPYGGFDGILLLDILSRYYSNYKILTNDILMNINNLAPLFLPVNKHGKQGNESASQLHEAYLSDMQILTFPAGLVSRYINKQVMDLEWKKNFITKSVHYQRDVVPVFCTGRNSGFFYGLSRFRKMIGIKANIEMLYLADETFRHKGEHITVIFGKPIPYSTFDHTKTPAQWAKWVKERVYELGGITNVPL
jgi:1-acyl-sn-glycerol-3-phosphate acyltransferase